MHFKMLLPSTDTSHLRAALHLPAPLLVRDTLSREGRVLQKQAGTVMSKWLNERHITSPLLSELTRNARECGWQRPLVSHLRLSYAELRLYDAAKDIVEHVPLASCHVPEW